MQLLAAATFYGKKVNYEVSVPDGLPLDSFRRSLAVVLERAKETRRRALATATPFPFVPFDVMAVQVWDRAAGQWRLLEEVCRHMSTVELVDWTQLYIFQAESTWHKEAVDQEIPRPEPLPSLEAADPPSLLHLPHTTPEGRAPGASPVHPGKQQAPVPHTSSPGAASMPRTSSPLRSFTPPQPSAAAPRGSAWERSASVRTASLAREVDERSVADVFTDLFGSVAAERGVLLTEWLDALSRPDLNLGIPQDVFTDVFRKITAPDVQDGDPALATPLRSGSVLASEVPIELVRTTPGSLRELARAYGSLMQYLRRKLSLVHEDRMVRADLEEAKTELLRQRDAVEAAQMEEQHTTRAVREQTARFGQARAQTKEAEAREDAVKRELSVLQSQILRERNELKTCEDDLLSAERDVSRQTDAGILLKDGINTVKTQVAEKEGALREAEQRMAELEAQMREQRKIVDKCHSSMDRLKYELAELTTNLDATEAQATEADARAATLKQVFRGHDEKLQGMAAKEADTLSRLKTLTEVTANTRSYEQLEEEELMTFEKRHVESAAAHQHLVVSLGGLNDAVSALEQLLQDGKDTSQHERSLVMQHVQLKHRKDVLDEQERMHALKREEMMSSTRRPDSTPQYAG
eukprot:TRINITY_DN32311_c0_g1_i1.p1 TRINITY_DN32311_c0_g1~~TRINITY_DN32311_c0_g1_i1.p1  ORF type:complete len:638 (+),score=211.79 TRINITY_DN32311_c0_g1_i1:61-1974(+)